MTEFDDFDDSAPGWEAIDEAFTAIYGDQEPLHYGTVIKYSMGGPDPIDGVSIYRSEKGRPHWHYVTYGFTELYMKDSENAEYSGFGFELTMRIARDESEDAPPVWPVSLMQNLARYVFDTGSIFEQGHYLDCQSEIALGTGTDLHAIIFVHDPEVPARDTPHGKVEFLQMVGVTLDELAAVMEWNTVGFATVLAERAPYLVTDLKRKSIVNEPDVRKQIDEGVEKEGSSTGALFISQLDWRLHNGKCTLHLGALSIPDLIAVGSSRIRHERPLIMSGANKRVTLVPAQSFSAAEVDEGLQLELTPADMSAFSASVQPKAGDYIVNDRFSVKVLKTEIKDQTGKVVEVVG